MSTGEPTLKSDDIIIDLEGFDTSTDENQSASANEKENEKNVVEIKESEDEDRGIFKKEKTTEQTNNHLSNVKRDVSNEDKQDSLCLSILENPQDTSTILLGDSSLVLNDNNEVGVSGAGESNLSSKEEENQILCQICYEYKSLSGLRKEEGRRGSAHECCSFLQE